jgi:GntR family transcriptional regulator/MocR family aminotransferase
LTSQPIDILVAVTRNGSRTLGAQIEDQLRSAIRTGRLRPGSRVPSTRDLADQLGVSRPIVVDAYAQLSAEGYLELRQGARPRVSACARSSREPATGTAPVPPRLRFDFRPGVPDLSSFPRTVWLRMMREALAKMPDADLGYTDPHGSAVLRVALSDYLGRVRGVVSDPSRVIVTSGFHQGRKLLCRALASVGAKRIAVEDPCHGELTDAVTRAGLTLVPIPVDSLGMRIDALEHSGADAVVLTPAHQYPTGAVLSGERRAPLIEWLRHHETIAIEDDYDAEYRYDRAPVGALQSLDADRIVYAGTASKTLAPALRLAWLVVPERLREPVLHQRSLADWGSPRIDQHAFAEFLTRGELDRHLRRMRGRYRARRDALVEAMRRALPEAKVCGIAAGLHAAIQLPEGHDERRIREEALRRGVGLSVMSEYAVVSRGAPPTLLIGYAGSPEPTLRAGVRELAAAVRAAAHNPKSASGGRASPPSFDRRRS